MTLIRWLTSELGVVCVIIVVSTFTSSCNEGCEDFDNLPEFDSLIEIPNTNDVKLDCIDYVNVSGSGYISTQDEYESVFEAPMGAMQEECQPDSLPTVDFTERDIIWFYTIHEIVSTKLVRDGDTLSYYVKIQESIFGIGRFRMNCLSIPKIGSNDTVVFKPFTHGCK